MICLAYCRFSSEAQRDGYSIEAQMRAINEWAEREGHIIKKFYIDEAKSGTNDNREEFQQMIADADESVQLVVVHKLDRFARDRYASAVYRHKLKEHGIRVVSVLEPLDDSPESIMMEAVLEGMAEYYSMNLSREVRKGQKEAALKAQHVTGPVPYGFKLDENRHYVIVPEEAAIIREIFRQLDAGQGIADVTRWARKKGIKTRTGSLVSENFIMRLTTNTKLIGRYSYGIDGKYKNEPIVIEDAFESILEPDVFWRQYNRTKSRSKGPRKRLKEEEYMLTGYLYCEHCGKHCYGFTSKNSFKLKSGELREYEKHYYRCATKGSRGKASRRLDPDFVPPSCELKNLEKEPLEDFVFAAINHVLFSDCTFDWLVAEMTYIAKTTPPVNQKEIDGRKKELEKIRAQQNKLLDLYLSEGITKAAFTTKSEELSVRAEFVEKELQRLSPSRRSPDDFSEIKKRLTAFANSANADSPEYKRRLLAVFVDRITVSNERIVIYFKFRLPGTGDSIEKPFEDYFVRKKTDTPHFKQLKILFNFFRDNC